LDSSMSLFHTPSGNQLGLVSNIANESRG
jgi:hypothetical protein